MKTLPTTQNIRAMAALAPWFQALAHLQQVQRACDAALAACGIPAGACAVEKFSEGELHLAAASPAAAARLRQTLPTLARTLAAQGLAVRTCRLTAVRIPE